MKTKKKRILVIVISLVLVAAIAAGIFFGTRGKSEPVGVYPFNQVGMTEYWGDSQESYGPVTTDKIQNIFLSDTQTVTEILVSQGDEVKKGDLLLTFDTTLSDLALERKRLEVEKLKLDLETAQRELTNIKSMKPMVIPTFDFSDAEDGSNGVMLADPYRVSVQKEYDGSSGELSLICWIRDDTSMDDGLLETLRKVAQEYQNYNAEMNPPEPEEGAGEEAGSGEEPGAGAESGTGEAPHTEGEAGGSESGGGESGDSESGGESGSGESGGGYVPFDVYSYYVIFKVTSGNMSLGSRMIWQGLKVSGSGSDFSFRFFDAYGVPDHMAAMEDEDAGDTEQPSIDYGSGYTAAQIAEMRSAKEKEIKDIEFKIKMADAEYKIAQTEMADGNIYAEFDGKVTSVLTEEEAKQQGVPVLKVSGGGGFYISCTVGELDKDSMVIGQEVTVNDWNTGMTYTGTVSEIGDFPSEEGYWSGSGNPTVSYYPLTVFVDETAELQAGMYASVTFSAASSQHGIYLRNPFLRTEGGESFVFIQGKSGKLEKRVVTVGKSLWGRYTEILSGLTEEDLIAFPYGKTVKEGAPAQEGDVSDLYNY